MSVGLRQDPEVFQPSHHSLCSTAHSTFKTVKLGVVAYLWWGQFVDFIRFAGVVASDMHPVNNLRILKYLTGEMSLKDEQKMQWMHHWMHKGFTVCETMLGEQSSKFCYGDEPTFADICLVPQIYNALRFKVDMSAYPRLMAVYEHALKHPAFDAAQPEKQPDCPPAT